MAFNQDFIMGFISGTVVGAVGYRLYEQNGAQLNRLVQESPLNMIPQNTLRLGTGYEPTIEELVAQKEKLDDLIAERELKN
jgi:hypothetical protein